MNKLVWVGFPVGIGVLLLFIVVMASETGTGQSIQYKMVKTDDGIEGKLGFIDKKIGEGPAVKIGDTALVLYTGKLKNGKVFDTNKKKGGQPFPVSPVGGREVVPGFDDGLIGMKKGGVRELIIPPELGYGEKGAGDRIPPNSELIFEVELLQIVQTPRGMPPGHP